MNTKNYFDDNNGRIWNFICFVILVLFLLAITFVCALGIYLNNEGYAFFAYTSFLVALVGGYVWCRCLFNFIRYVREPEQEG